VCVDLLIAARNGKQVPNEAWTVLLNLDLLPISTFKRSVVARNLPLPELVVAVS
jgi:hypothetical protein